MKYAPYDGGDFLARRPFNLFRWLRSRWSDIMRWLDSAGPIPPPGPMGWQ